MVQWDIYIETNALNDATAIRESSEGLKSSRNRLELRRAGESDPKPKIGAEDTAELLGAESGGGFRDTKTAGDVGVRQASGKAEEADAKAGMGGEVEGEANGVTAFEERLEEAREPFEGDGGHVETFPE